MKEMMAMPHKVNVQQRRRYFRGVENKRKKGERKLAEKYATLPEVCISPTHAQERWERQQENKEE